MLPSVSEMRYVLAASYEQVEDALAAFESIDVAYRHVGSSLDFDATVIAKDETGKVEIVRRHNEPKRHDTQVGLGGVSPPAPWWPCSRPSASSARSRSAAAPARRSARSRGTPPAA